jgi:hypothetical protein
MRVTAYMLGWLEAVAAGHVRRLSQIPAHTARALQRRVLLIRDPDTLNVMITMHGDHVLAGARAERGRRARG